MALITYDDKVNYQSSSLANEYKVTAGDMNEIKSVVNNMPTTVYPVGSIYTSSNNTNPSSIFGGTWTQVECNEIIQSGTLSGTNLNRGFYRIYANGDFDAWGESNALASQATGTSYNMMANLPFTPSTWVITPGFGQCGDWSGCDTMSVYGSGYIGVNVWNGTGYTKTNITSNFMCKGTLNLASNNIATLYSWKRTA